MRDEVTGSKALWRQPKVWVPLMKVLFLGGSFALYYFNSKSAVETELAAIRKRGLPSAPVELDAWYRKIPAESNAALVLQEAYSLHVEPGSDNPQELGKELKVGEPLSDELRAAAEDYLKDNAETLEKVRAAAQLREARFPIDLTTGFSAL